MKTPASSVAARRRVRNVSKLQRQRRKKQPVQSKTSPEALEGLAPMHPRAAGIDVGSMDNYVAVPVDEGMTPKDAVRAFGVFSQEQDALVEWLREHRITTVAMEATGVYWISLYDKIEAAGIEVYLVDPHSVKAVPGRKSDWIDCQWLQRLHTYGLLARAFRPDPAIRRLRTLTRQRSEIVATAAEQEQRMGKVLVCMNLHLNLAVSDVTGETGLRIIRAILDGVRDPKELVKLRDPRCHKSTVAEMEAALTGTYDEEELFVLRQTVEGWDFCHKQMETIDQRINQVLGTLESAQSVSQPIPPKPVPPAQSSTAKKKRPDHGPNAPVIDFTQELIRICGVNLMKVCGMNILTVLMLIGEIGVDMSRWRSARAFCSWLGLCPGTNISGGKVLSRRTRRVKNRASTILRMAAWGAGKTDTWLGRFYRRIKARRGAPKAVTATARKIACIVYHMLKYKEEFVLLDTSQYEAKAEEHRLRRLKKEAKQLGYDLVEIE